MELTAGAGSIPQKRKSVTRKRRERQSRSSGDPGKAFNERVSSRCPAQMSSAICTAFKAAPEQLIAANPKGEPIVERAIVSQSPDATVVGAGTPNGKGYSLSAG